MILSKKQKASLKEPIFIEGLPGLGNVGKIVVDLLVNQLKAKKLCSFPIEEKPGLVLVQQNNRVRLPEMSLYQYKAKQDFLFLVGDGQPTSAAYDFAEALVALLEELSCKEIITIGGIGLQQVPETPNVYATGNNPAIIKRFKQLGVNPKLHGVVGPIIGLTGLLLPLSKGKIPAVALLAESLAHPMYLGLRGAERVLALLSKAYGFKLSLEELQESIAQLEAMTGQAPAGELPRQGEEASYIG